MSDLKKLHVVLDIDNTCIANSIDNEKYPNTEPNMQNHLQGDFGYHRPNLLEFLNKCFENFASVSLWTSAEDNWLHIFIKSLPESMRNKFLFTWSFRECIYICGIFIKPLCTMWDNKIAKNMGMNDISTIIVDDSKEVCVQNSKNHYHIKYYGYHDEDDRELDKAYQFLHKRNIDLLK
jgi:hypothetical protein